MVIRNINQLHHAVLSYYTQQIIKVGLTIVVERSCGLIPFSKITPYFW